MTPHPADASDAALGEALARARRHARNALAEALEAARALLDAASLATSGAAADAHPLFARAESWIRSTSQGLASEGGLPDELGASLAAALDAEIARWEERARSDDDARAVLRAFLGLREILWELGVRAPGSAAAPPDSAPPAPARNSAGSKPARRIERVAVQR